MQKVTLKQPTDEKNDFSMPDWSAVSLQLFLFRGSTTFTD
jgi:hypothetical protein